MRLIEKKCPNCGASLSFGENDKSCKCEYCKREFEIERDTDRAKTLADQFNLNEFRTPLKIFSFLTLGSFVTQIIIFIVAVIIIFVVGFSIFKSFNDNDNFFKDDTLIVSKISDLDSSDYSSIDLYSNITIRKSNELDDVHLKGSPKREKLYLLTKDGKNKIIAVYKVNYENIFNNTTYTIFTPVQYNNVTRKHNSIAFSLGDGEILGKEYYFNIDHNEFAYGYQELDSLYNEVIEPLSNEYKIEEK